MAKFKVSNELIEFVRKNYRNKVAELRQERYSQVIKVNKQNQNDMIEHLYNNMGDGIITLLRSIQDIMKQNEYFEAEPIDKREIVNELIRKLGYYHATPKDNEEIDDLFTECESVLVALSMCQNFSEAVEVLQKYNINFKY